MEAYSAYDFDGDERWRAYLGRLEVPPGREAVLEAKRQRWYKQHVDPDFEVAPAASAGAGAGARAAPRPPSPPPKPKPSPRAAAGPPPTAPRGAAAAPAGGGARLSLREGALLALHAWIVVAALLALQPFDRYLSFRAARWAAVAGAAAAVLRAVGRHGAPRARPLTALADWFGRLVGTTDMFHLVLAGTMLGAPHAWLGALPLGLHAVFHAAAAAHRAAGASRLYAAAGGARVHAFLAARQPAALRGAAVLEILVGVQLVVGALAGRTRGGLLPAAFQAYVYWNALRLRLAAPASRALHLDAWRALGRGAEPVLRAAPPLRAGVAAARRWFEAPAAGGFAGARPRRA